MPYYKLLLPRPKEVYNGTQKLVYIPSGNPVSPIKAITSKNPCLLHYENETNY